MQVLDKQLQKSNLVAKELQSFFKDAQEVKYAMAGYCALATIKKVYNFEKVSDETIYSLNCLLSICYFAEQKGFSREDIRYFLVCAEPFHDKVSRRGYDRDHPISYLLYFLLRENQELNPQGHKTGVIPDFSDLKELILISDCDTEKLRDLPRPLILDIHKKRRASHQCWPTGVPARNVDIYFGGSRIKRREAQGLL